MATVGSLGPTRPSNVNVGAPVGANWWSETSDDVDDGYLPESGYFELVSLPSDPLGDSLMTDPIFGRSHEIFYSGSRKRFPYPCSWATLPSRRLRNCLNPRDRNVQPHV